MTIGDANSGGNPAALLTNGPYTIGVLVTVNSTAGPVTLGTLGSGLTTFSSSLSLNGNNTVTLSSPAGGSVQFGKIYATGTGAVTIPAPSNVIFNSGDYVLGGNPPYRRDPDAQHLCQSRQRGNHGQQRPPDA